MKGEGDRVMGKGGMQCRNFRELNVWIESMEIAKSVYGLISELPEYEKFGLHSQLAKAAVSVPSNIAEGCGKSSNKDFKRFLEISLGSSYELETQLILASGIHGLPAAPVIEKLQILQRMLAKLLSTL
ncbi:MAG: four helix bundle protein [Cyclobacteriaceae bacterium]|nr:four helix bundle protein [Cyclobacteriaceae bacterium]